MPTINKQTTRPALVAPVALADRRRYERQIERLHQRYLLTSKLYEMRQSDVSLASIVTNRGKVARLLAREVGEGRYRLEPGELRTIRARHKTGEVFACRITDLIVHGVVADVVQDAFSPRLSRRVYSYRRGLSWLNPIAGLGRYRLRGRGPADGPADRRDCGEPLSRRAGPRARVDPRRLLRALRGRLPVRASRRRRRARGRGGDRPDP